MNTTLELKLEIQSALQQVDDYYLDQPLSKTAKVFLNDKQTYLEVLLEFPYLTQDIPHRFEKKIHNAVKKAHVRQGINQPFQIEFLSKIVQRRAQGELKPLKNIKNIIAVASGKGGVGKSTVSVNLALSLKTLGAKVGLVDADVYGPSLPTIFNDHGQPELKDNRFKPLEFGGIKVNSMGFLVGSETAVMWRGPMISKVFDQLINETDWGELDFLVIDLPPGTGDIQLSMAQNVPIAGVVVVTTPQDVALADVYRSVQMFKKLKIKILGVVENMASHICTNCGHKEAIFGVSRMKEISEKFAVPMIDSLPLSKSICDSMDQGKMKELSYEKMPFSKQYQDIARKISAFLSLQEEDEKHKFPDIQLK